MKKKTLTTLLLALCLSAQLNFCSAEKNYDEEITLPIGTNFDLEMEEVTRYEYDGEYVKALTINNKEQFILQKAGDTIINVIMDDKGVRTELRVLVHIVSEQQFNNPTATTTPGSATKPGTTAPNATAPGSTTKPGASTTPVATDTTKPAANTTTTTAAGPINKSTTPATVNSKQETPATATQASTPSNSEAPKQSPTTTTQQTTPTAPVKPTAVVTTQTIHRPTIQPQNNVEAIKYKADQYAFDVLDLVNAEREKYNLRPLSMAKDLMSEATVRARELPSRFSHTRPDGSKFFTVMSNPGTANGENMAAGQTTPGTVVKAWLNSSTHREVILSPAYTELGVGYYETTSANYPCYWIQLFRG